MIAFQDIRLWPLERHDLMKNYQWANDLSLSHYSGSTPVPRSTQDIEGWFASISSNPETLMFAIKTVSGEYLGNIELRQLDLRCGNAELGVFLGEETSRGRGYGTQAVLALLGFAFTELRLHRVYVHVLATNSRARRAFEKCGFRIEGCERDAHYLKGHYEDVNVLGLLEHEFTSIVPA